MEIAKLKRMYLLGREAQKESAKILSRNNISDRDYTFNFILNVFANEIRGVAVTSDATLAQGNIYPVFLIPAVRSLALLKLIDEDYFPPETYKLFRLMKEKNRETMNEKERTAFNEKVLSIASPFGYDKFKIEHFLSFLFSPFTLKLKEDKDYSSLVKLAFPSSDVIKTYEIGEIYSKMAIPGINLDTEVFSKLQPLYKGEAFLNEALAFLEKHHDPKKKLEEIKLDNLIKESYPQEEEDGEETGGINELRDLIMSVGKEVEIQNAAYEFIIIIYETLLIMRKLNSINLLPLSLSSIGTAIIDSFYESTLMESLEDFESKENEGINEGVEKEEAYLRAWMFLSLKRLAPVDPSFQELFEKNQGLLDKAYYYYYNQQTKLTKPEFEENLKSVEDVFLEKHIDFTKAFFDLDFVKQGKPKETKHMVLDILTYTSTSFDPLYGINKDKDLLNQFKVFFYWFHFFNLGMTIQTLLLTFIPKDDIETMGLEGATNMLLNHKHQEKRKEKKKDARKKNKPKHK